MAIECNVPYTVIEEIFIVMQFLLLSKKKLKLEIFILSSELQIQIAAYYNAIAPYILNVPTYIFMGNSVA